MKKILAIVGISIAAFLIGFLAIYFAMPYLAPERYEKVQHTLDSLRAIEAALAGDSTLLGDSTLVLDSTLVDSLGRPLPTLSSTISRLDATLDSLREAQERTVALLRDSLREAHERLQNAEKIGKSLQARVNELNHRLQTIEEKRQEAKNLSDVLPKLENKELGPILAKLDMGVLQRLYIEASARNRTKILQALPADRAALFVTYLMNGTLPEETLPGGSSTATPDLMTTPAGASAPLTSANQGR